MKITRACDYAIRAIMTLGVLPQGTVMMRQDLARAASVPDCFLGKIMQSLVRYGLLISERGKKGGFKLERSVAEITLYDVVAAVEGEEEILISECLVNDEFCVRYTDCKVHSLWKTIQQGLVDKLKSVSIKDVS